MPFIQLPCDLLCVRRGHGAVCRRPLRSCEERSCAFRRRRARGQHAAADLRQAAAVHLHLLPHLRVHAAEYTASLPKTPAARPAPAPAEDQCGSDRRAGRWAPRPRACGGSGPVVARSARRTILLREDARRPRDGAAARAPAAARGARAMARAAARAAAFARNALAAIAPDHRRDRGGEEQEDDDFGGLHWNAWLKG